MNPKEKTVPRSHFEMAVQVSDLFFPTPDDPMGLKHVTAKYHEMLTRNELLMAVAQLHIDRLFSTARRLDSERNTDRYTLAAKAIWENTN